MTAGTLLAAGAGPSPLWYATRATGVVALILLTATVILGITGAARFATWRWPRMITAGLHRNLSLLVVSFLAVHILTALADTYAPVGWASVVIPFVSAYRPLWLGLGTIAFDLVLALVATSLLRARIGRRSWRAVHWCAYAAWPVALWHGLGTGTDSRLPWLLGIDAVCVAAVVAAVCWRLSLVAHPGRRLAGFSAGAALPAATIIFVAVGPLRPGWAARAGTPAALLGHATASAAAPARGGEAGRPPAGPASAPLRGSITESTAGGPGSATVLVRARTRRPARQRVVVTLHGTPGAGGGITLSSGTVTVAPAAGGSVYRGPVTSLKGGTVEADLAGPGGYRARVRIVLVISGTAVSGRLVITPGGGR